jgi:hypothetical protein
MQSSPRGCVCVRMRAWRMVSFKPRLLTPEEKPPASTVQETRWAPEQPWTWSVRTNSYFAGIKRRPCSRRPVTELSRRIILHHNWNSLSWLQHSLWLQMETKFGRTHFSISPYAFQVLPISYLLKPTWLESEDSFYVMQGQVRLKIEV